MSSSASALLRRAHYAPLALALGYVTLLALLMVPAIQREVLFLHHVAVPPFAKFDNPEKYGLAPYKTRNLRLNTSDGVSLGAWHVLPRSVYTAQDPWPPEAPLSPSVFGDALTQRPTIIYFHGNAGNRATSHRVRSYSAYSNTLDCNVIALDYRGFGDSAGVPSEQGLLVDARRAYDHVADAIAAASGLDSRPERQIILVGHSLGTGVASGLAAALAREDIHPRAIALIAPFTSLAELLTSYRLFWFIPVLGPLSIFPAAQHYLRGFLIHQFDSASALVYTTSPTLLVHATDDMDIPHSHSAQLYSALRGNNPANETSFSYERWGTVRTTSRTGKGDVMWWEGHHGGHNHLDWAEGTIDLIARIARL
ncbi:hypothetical protein IAU60_005739 [Kwoniella sp. DSM 27419]